MLSIIHISENIERPCTEIIVSGGKRNEGLAPVLASFDVTIFNDETTGIHWIEVREAPRGILVIEWSDTLQELLSSNHVTGQSRNDLAQLAINRYRHPENLVNLPLQLQDDA